MPKDLKITNVSRTARPKEIKKQLNFSAAWLPTLSLLVGDVGTLINYEFRHVSNLHQFGIKFSPKTSYDWEGIAFGRIFICLFSYPSH